MSADTIGILIIGSELLDGRICDRNVQYIAQEFLSHGLTVSRTTTCDDSLEDIQSALTYLRAHCSQIITTGGLGPTSDDITRDGVAAFLNKNLEENATALDGIKAYFERKKRPYIDANTRQALIPEGAEIIENPVGSAPGFIAQGDRHSHIISLPGVPRELRAMLPDVLKHLEGIVGKRGTIASSTLRFFGVPEAQVGAEIDALALHSSISVSYRAHFPEIIVRLNGSDTDSMATAARRIKEAVGTDYCYSESAEEDLPLCLQRELERRNETLAVAESCTAGMLGALCTKHAGSSVFFQGGVLTYSNKLKEQLLSVSKNCLETFGAVSHQTAQQMAAGVQAACGTNLGISTTGIAGPDGGSEEKPVGLFYVGLAYNGSVTSHEFFFSGERGGVRRFAAMAALDVARRRLLQLPDRSVSNSSAEP